MADIRNCKECGRLFQYTGYIKICPKCQREDEQNFRIVKEYIYDNAGATLTEVAEETGVVEDKILRYLREGRLEIAGENSALFLDCERCGKGIRSGRFCEDCANTMEKELKSGFTQIEKPNAETSHKMFTAEMKKKRS
ncbi:MerR family transcriptional regulator [Clostridiaceae bacterium 35-E11]